MLVSRRSGQLSIAGPAITRRGEDRRSGEKLGHRVRQAEKHVPDAGGDALRCNSAFACLPAANWRANPRRSLNGLRMVRMHGS